jgi:hypothetical protein
VGVEVDAVKTKRLKAEHAHRCRRIAHLHRIMLAERTARFRLA